MWYIFKIILFYHALRKRDPRIFPCESKILLSHPPGGSGKLENPGEEDLVRLTESAEEDLEVVQEEAALLHPGQAQGCKAGSQMYSLPPPKVVITREQNCVVLAKKIKLR